MIKGGGAVLDSSSKHKMFGDGSILFNLDLHSLVMFIYFRRWGRIKLMIQYLSLSFVTLKT